MVHNPGGDWTAGWGVDLTSTVIHLNLVFHLFQSMVYNHEEYRNLHT